MRMRPRRIFQTTGVMILLAMSLTGCAQRMQSVKDDSVAEINANAALQSIKVSEDGNQVEIAANKPMIFTSYQVTSPPKLVIDLSQTEPGAMTAPLEFSAGNIRRVEVTRLGLGQNVLSRVEISLATAVDFTVNTNPDDKSRLVVALAKPAIKSEAKVDEKQLKVENLSPPVPAEAKNGEKQIKSEAVTAKPDENKPAAPNLEGNGFDKQTPKDEKKSSASAPKGTILSAVNVVTTGIDVVVPGGIETFTSFKLSNPSRLVVDIPGVKSGLAAKEVAIKRFGIEKARIGLSPDKLRIVLDTTQKSIPPYRIDKSENGLIILLDSAAVASSPKPAAEPAKEAAAQKTPAARAGTGKMSSVEAIDFQPVEGYSRLSIKVSGACSAGKPKKTASGWLLTISRCQLPRKFQRVLDTSAFASPVQEITPYQVRTGRGYDTRVLVKLRKDVPFNFSQEGDTVYWNIKNPESREKSAAVAETAKPLHVPASAALPKAAAPSAVEKDLVTEKPVIIGHSPDKKKVYTGRRVTLEFSDADVRKIFQLIAEVSNLNFLIADDVSGTISLKLVNVPWDQALDVILDSKNLEMKRDGNIVQVKPKGKFKTQEQEEADAKREREKRMELVTRVFEINFASIADMEAKFKELGSKLPGTSVLSDKRTNKIIATDNENRLKRMAELLAKLDSPEKQVMIEARIVEATSTFTRDLGVQWGIHYKDGSAGILGVNQLDTGFGGILTQVPPTSGFQTFDSAGGSMGVSFGKLTSNIQIDMRLAAAATAGLVKIVSTPKVVTLNNKVAKISQGQSIPYQTTSAEGTKTQFVEATLSLEVTPHITPDGNIGMQITATNNSAGTGTPPSINMKQATTELQVMNGETTVIGGIYIDSDTETDSGVPFLMDIPLLGWMFKSNNKSKVKTELLIFITPKIVS